jgi:hypothetical protein
METKDSNLPQKKAMQYEPLLCAGLVILVYDFGRMHQRSFSTSDIYKGVDMKKYKVVKWVEITDEKQKQEVEKKAKRLNFDTKVVNLYG